MSENSDKKITKRKGPVPGSIRLTPKRERFCQNIFKGMTQRAAYKDAFNPPHMKDYVIDREASVLCRNPVVVARIKEIQEELRKDNQITVEKVLEELAHIAFDDVKNYLAFRNEKQIVGLDEQLQPVFDYQPIVEVKDSNDIDTRGISEVVVDSKGGFKFKLYPKDVALQKLGQYLGLFIDRSEITGKDGGPIEINDARNILIEKLNKKRNEG
jgi:phage terminase small subunit